MASSDPEFVCSICRCKKDDRPCDSCIFFKFQCRGTCPCCEEHRKEVFKDEPSASTSDKIQVPESICTQCNCKKNGRPCDICSHFKLICKGTCPCCEKYRNLLSKKYHSASPTKKTKVLVNKCSHCDCHSGHRGCKMCFRSKFTCAGNCRCCAGHRRRNKVTVDEKYVDKVMSNEVISSAQGQAKKIIFIPPEMLNNRTRGNLQQPPEVPQIIISGTPPAVPEPVSEEKKMEKKILCSQCFCDGDVIPCKICVVKVSQCRGACPCCTVKAQQVLLNPGSRKFCQQICPRCLCRPGEGTCEFCIKKAEEKAASVASTDQNLPSTSGTSLKRKKNVSKAAVRAKSSVNPADVRARQVLKRSSSPVVLPVESPRKRMRTIPVILPFAEEYCLLCNCAYEKEPCNFCGKEFNCFGRCICCKNYNKQLLAFDEVPPIEDESLDEIPDVQVKVRISSAIETHHQKSTSVIHTDHSYSQSNKCVDCSCIKYVKQCNICLTSDPPCTFSEGETFCSCCWDKLGIGK